jgi:hypothetical protein
MTALHQRVSPEATQFNTAFLTVAHTEKNQENIIEISVWFPSPAVVTNRRMLLRSSFLRLYFFRQRATVSFFLLLLPSHPHSMRSSLSFFLSYSHDDMQNYRQCTS